MSIVGPRPLLLQYLELYSFEQVRRHEGKLGITGWAQVNWRNAINCEEQFQLNVSSIERQASSLYLKIIFKTCIKAFVSEGINSEGQASTFFLQVLKIQNYDSRLRC
jgi:lipopolysaccharide/colanic/teichoic acid biosynthesis glycosyltransferase